MGKMQKVAGIEGNVWPLPSLHIREVNLLPLGQGEPTNTLTINLSPCIF